MLRILILLLVATLLQPGSLVAQQRTGNRTPASSAGTSLRQAPVRNPQGPFRPRNAENTPTIIVAGGYCLVSLRDEQTWTQGNPQTQLVFNNRIYYFAGIRQRNIFIASREQYLPVLDGDSMVAFAETGERASGSLEFGLTYRGRIFFFRDAAEKARFEAEPQVYVDADLVDDGLCPVSRVEEGQRVAGLPETVTTLDGLRYFFASAHHRRLFLANPQRYAESTEATSQDLVVHPGTAESRLRGLPTPSDPDAASSAGDNSAAGNDTSESNSERESGFYSRPAISGYCPVAIRKQGVWIRGKSKFKAAFDGKIYHMAGAEELALFREHPREFSPVLGGDSVVALAERGERVAGSAYQPLIAGDRLFLFVDTNEKQLFKDHPELYEDADLALQGNSLVSLLEKQREVPGLPAFETLFQGLRYRFADEDQLNRFLAGPEAFIDQYQSQVAQ